MHRLDLTRSGQARKDRCREPGRLIGEPYAYSEWGNVGWDFAPDGTIVLLNPMVAETEAEMNTAGRNHLIDAASGLASQADEWMFGPGWQRLVPDASGSDTDAAAARPGTLASATRLAAAQDGS